uniref:Zinc finger protein 407 n=1 Tax=Xenopus tropicalis TaxID=8364 RepID=A0A6I8Q4H9_XENTR
MESKQECQDKSSADEPNFENRIDIEESSIIGDPVGEKPLNSSSSISSAKKVSGTQCTKRLIQGTHTSQKLEGGCAENEPLSKRPKIEEGTGDGSDTYINPNNKDSTVKQVPPLANITLLPNNEKVCDIQSIPQEGVLNAEENIDTVSSSGDFNSKHAENLYSSNCALIEDNSCPTKEKSVQIPVNSVSIQSKIYSCDICGFQCSKENLLHEQHNCQAQVLHENFGAPKGLSKKIHSGVKKKSNKSKSKVIKSKFTANIETNSDMDGENKKANIGRKTMKQKISRELKNISKIILAIKAKRQKDRAAFERSHFFRRKYGFGHVRKKLHMRRIIKKGQARLKPLAIPSEMLHTEYTNCTQMLDDRNSTAMFEDVSKTSTLHTCVNCKELFPNENALEAHVKKQHNEEIQFYCQSCGFFCINRRNFETHCDSNCSPTVKCNLECHICSAVAADIMIFENHMSVNHNLRFHCDVCKLYFRLREELLHHEKTQHHLQILISGDKLALQMSDPRSIQSQIEIDNIATTTEVATEENHVKKGAENVSHFETGKQQFQCKKCFYKTRSSTVLTRHIKLRHAHDYYFLCKACNIYSMCKEGMEKHIKRSKHIENAWKNNIGLLFEECIEKVWFDGISDPNIAEDRAKDSQPFPVLQNRALPSADGNLFSSQDSSGTDVLRNERKKGKSKGSMSRLCNYCGLVASSVTNLSVHIRRKHSHQYSYLCKVCNYYTVTKGDMERHCTTKKHNIRVGVENNGPHKIDVIVTSDGRHFESRAKKKETLSPSPLDNGHTNSVTTEKPVNTSDTLPVQQVSNPICSINLPEDSPVFEVRVTVAETNATSENDIIKKDSLKTGNKKNTLSLVEKQHTEEFQYYCMACEHYTVTHSEMMGHVITEKHKINYQAYKSQSSSVTDVTTDNVQKSSDDLSNQPVQGNNECLTAITHNPKLNVEIDSHVSASEQGEKVALNVPETTTAYLKESTEINTNCEQKSLDHKVSTEKGQENGIERQHIVSSVGVNDKVKYVKYKDDSVVEMIQLKNGESISNAHSDEIILEADNEMEVCSVEDTVGLDRSSGDIAVELSTASGTYSADQSREEFDSSIVKLHKWQVEAGAVQPLKRKKGCGKSQKGKSRIRCDDCGFLADGLSGLNVHIAMKHLTKEKHFHCLLCGKSFFSESNLHQHLSSVGHIRNEQESFEELPEGGATFKCVKCTEHFDSEQSLFLHIKEKHEELLREVNKYIEEDTEQINKEREENKGNVCKYCGKKCKSSNSMAFLAHIRTHTGSKPFKCKICHFAAAQLGDARNHVKRHLGMREYKCHVCGKFSCNLCDRSFRERWALNNHMKLHTGEKPFKCTWPTCHYSFLTASAMKDHYRTHTGEKSFLCDLCGFAGGTRHALTKHRRQHTGEKPFKCDECNFASTTQSHLTRHKRVHTGEKPYRCPWCEYRSNCAENVRKHILHTGKHEGVKMYNCPKCDYATNVPVEFRNHLKEQHVDIENPDLAYLHAGIVSKSFECRIKGQGANFVETTSPFTASSTIETSPLKEKTTRSTRRQSPATEQVQQVIIIQGFSEEYDGDFTIDASVEETAAATLQTLAMAGQVARVVHITEDGQVIATDQAAHMNSIIPGEILREQLQDGATQVVVVEGPVEETEVAESVSIETVTDSTGNVVQQVMAQGILDPSQTMHAADSSSALDALLCAVTELGNVDEGNAQQDRTERTVEESVVRITSNQECSNPSAGEIQMYHEVHDAPQSIEPIEVVRQVMHSSSILTSQESAQVAFKNMVQGVLQFAVCDSDSADQLGVTQVIVNDEGTVHMVSSEGPRIIMHNAESHTLNLPEQNVDLVESDEEISQIIVTEELARAMVQNVSSSFTDGTTHYIVTELPQDAMQKESGVFSHAVIQTDESGDILHAETTLGTEIPCEATSEDLTSMTVYTECSSQDIHEANQKEAIEEQVQV